MSDQLEQVRSRALALAFSGNFQSVEQVEAALGDVYPESWQLLQENPDYRSYIGQIAYNSSKKSRG